VVGDLNDLIPNWPERPEGTQLSDMQGVSDTDLLETAIDGFFGMAAAIQRRSKAEGKR
jgi:hypothetical protein